MAMGATAIAIIYSPIRKRSGAHFNPAVTLTFWRLGKVETWDALGYAFSQFIGGTVGVLMSAWLLGKIIADPTVNYAATVPGHPAYGLHSLPKRLSPSSRFPWCCASQIDRTWRASQVYSPVS
jgi:aquaporin Z